MPREYAAMRLSMWDDEQFLDCTPDEQHLLFVLATSPTLSYCGVADWRPARLSRRARDWTPARVRGAAFGLVERLFVVVDEDTEEVLVRSFLRDDGLLKSPNLAIAAANAYADVASRGIRGVLVHELVRLREDFPDWKAWDHHISKDRMADLLAKPAVDPATYPLGNPFGNPSLNPSGNPFGKGFPNPSPNPSGNPSVQPSLDPSLEGSANPSGNPSPTPAPSPAPSTSTLPAPTERAPQTRRTPARNVDSPEARVANRVYDHAQGMVGWADIQQIAKRALRVQDTTEDLVAQAMCQLYDDRKPITLQTVGQAINASRADARPARPDRAAERGAAAHASAAALAAHLNGTTNPPPQEITR